MKNKYFKWGEYHVFQCFICYDMEQRGYRSESYYWKSEKLRKIKYKLIKLDRKGNKVKYEEP